MPGMNSGVGAGNSILVAAFRSALLQQGAIALVVIVFVWLGWITIRAWLLPVPAGKPASGEPAADPGEAPGTSG
ncbi:MAG: hypothetical protein ACRDOL_14050, partial [Streptosporangiaceae bacterium]